MGVGRVISAIRETFPGRLRTVRETLLWMLRLRTRHRVVNLSMEPTLSPGDYLLVNPNAYRRSLPAPGDLVIARHPFEDVVLTKRVAEVMNDQVLLASDNLDSGQDSRHFGPLPRTLMRGQVTCVIR